MWLSLSEKHTMPPKRPRTEADRQAAAFLDKCRSASSSLAPLPAPSAFALSDGSSIFSTEFLQTLTSEESKTLTDFYAAATQIRRPKVRKTCREAGFIREPEELTKDGIFLAFQK